MLKLLDNTEKIKREIETLEDPCWHEKLNGLNILEFTTLDRDIKNKDRIVFQDELGIWHEFIVESIDDTHEDVFVYCEDSFYETRGDYIDDRRFVNANFSTVADAVMSYTRWKLKIVDDIGIGTVNFYHTDVKSAVFEDMQNKFDFEIKTYVEITNSRISQRVIELRKQRGHDNGKRFTYDKDIDSISRTIDSTEFCTALYAYGKGEETENGGYGRRIDISKVNNGKKYVENTKAKEQFGKYVNGKREHIFATYIFEDIDDRKKLLEQAKKKLEELSEFKVTYKCDVLVLNKLLEDRAHEGIELGDTVAIIDKDINIRIRARVVERKSYPNSTKPDEIVLGNFIEDYATQQAKIKSDLKSISNTINEQGQAIVDLKNFDYHANIVQELNDRINSTGGYVYISKDGQGLITYDKPIDKNPTKAIQLKGGAIRIANSKRGDGSWNWTTFGTGDGFTADKIITGILKGGSVHWNLEDGTFLIGKDVNNYKFYWDGSTLHMRDVDIDLSNNSTLKNISESVDKNNDDIKKANDVISQTQTSVQILKDRISTKVSRTEILTDKEIQRALKGKDGTFTGEIGARNLIKNSDDLSGCFVKYDGGNHRITDEEMKKFGFGGKRLYSEAGNQTNVTKEILNLDTENLIDGKTYTFSMYVKNNRDVPMKFNAKSIESDYIELQPNEVKRIVVTGKRIEDTYANGKFRVFFNANTKDYYIDCTIGRPQLEIGDVATDWSPAPEDLLGATKIVRNEFESFRNQTNEALTDKVSITSYNANNQQIRQQISSVTQTANSITQRVSDLNKDLDDKVSTIKQTTDSITSTVSSAQGAISKLEADSSFQKALLDEHYTDLRSRISSIQQTADSITLTVSKKIGKSEVESLIKQTVDNITIKASQIDFSGNVSITGELRTKYYSGNTALWMKNDSLKAYEDNSYNSEIGYFGGRKWSGETYPYHLSISHGMDYHTTISYEGSSNYHPYILFDAYNNVDPSFVDSSGNATIRKHQYDPVGGIKYMMRELHTERNYFTDKVFHQDHVWVQKDLYFGNGVGIERAGRDDYVVFGKMSQVGGVANGGLRFMNNGRVYTEGSVFVNNEIRWNGNYPIFFGNGYGIQLTSSYIAIGRITSDGTVRDGIYIEGTNLRALRDNKLGATLN